MELVGQNRTPLPVPRFAIHLQLPLYLRLMLDLLLGVMFIVSGATVLTRHMQPPINPFADFGELFADDAHQTVLAWGFTCAAVNFSSNPRTITDYCEMRISHALFSQISLGLLGNVANEISFAVRENTLTVGDLAALWGKPEFKQYGDIVAATWPDQHVTATALPPQTGRISYFLPVLHVFFTRSGPPRWSLLLMIEKLPMLCNTCGGL